MEQQELEELQTEVPSLKCIVDYCPKPAYKEPVEIEVLDNKGAVIEQHTFWLCKQHFDFICELKRTKPNYILIDYLIKLKLFKAKY